MQSSLLRYTGVFVLLLAGGLFAEEPGGASPEAVFQKYQQAFAAGKFKTAFSQITAESQGMMIGDMLSLVFLYGSSDHPLASEVNTVLKKHGIPLETTLGKDLTEPLAAVKDKPACLEECIQCIAKHSKETFSASTAKMQNTALADLIIRGDTASANMISKQDGQEKADPIKFKKVGNSWLIDLTQERGAHAKDSQNQTTNNRDFKSRPELPQPSR